METEAGQSRSDKVLNFVYCCIDAIGWPLGAAFFSAATIMPVFLKHLHAGDFLIGCLPALTNLLTFSLGFLSAGYISRLRRARGYLFYLGMAERLVLLPLIPLTVLWGHSHPDWLIAVVFICLGLQNMGMGLNQPAYWVVIGKTVPSHWRGRLYGYAGGIAGVLGLGVERVLHHMLSGPNGGFPQGFSSCFLVGFIIFITSFLVFLVIREPEGVGVSDEHSGHYLRDSLQVWRANHGFRRFIYSHAIFQSATLATPFYILAANHKLGLDAGAIAAFTAILVFATSFGSLIWGVWADRVGNKAILIYSSLCAIIAPVGALLAVSHLAFYGIFVALALAAAGGSLAGFNIVMEFTPHAGDIPLYTSMANALTTFPRAAAPLLGGLLAEITHGYNAGFIVSAALAVGSLLLTLRFQEPRRLREPSA